MTIRESDLPTLLKKLRGDKSQIEFGLQYGASRQLVNNWEAGRSRPNPETLKKMGIQIFYTAKV